MKLTIYWSIRIASVGLAILISYYLPKTLTTKLEKVTNNYKIGEKKQYAVLLIIISTLACAGYTLLYFIYDDSGLDKIAHAAIAILCLVIIIIMTYILGKKKIGSF